MGKDQLQIADKRPVAWAPQPGPQHQLVTCPLPEIFYGGARGGGKTDGVLGKYAIKALRYGKGFNAIFFRHELPMLDDAIERSKEIYSKLGAEYIEYKKTWTFPGGGRLRFRSLERVQDAEKYQGQNISDACVEEAGNYPDPSPIDRLNGVLRSVYGVPTQLILTGNPGGAGNIWINQRYVVPHKAGMRVLTRKLPNGELHKYIFIPSKIQNNRKLLENDPGYINRLYLVGSEQLVEAWLDGNFDVFEGQSFTWNYDRHVIKPQSIPPGVPMFMTFDWGFGAPFSIGWWWVDSDGRGYRFHEWYGAQESNSKWVGLRLTDDDIAMEILRIEREDLRLTGRTIQRYAGPDCFNKKPDYQGGGQGDSTFTTFLKYGVHLRPGDANRKLKIRQMHQRLKIPTDGSLPMLVVYDHCKHFIRTVPALQFDSTSPEDIDTKMEDHIYDEACHFCMCRPMAAIPQSTPYRDDLNIPSVPVYHHIFGEDQPTPKEQYINLDQ